MKKILFLFTLVLLATGLMAQKIVNDPNAEARKVSSFHGIKVSNAFDVYISQGNTDAVAISASDEETRKKIETKVENGILIVRLDADKNFWKGWNNSRKKLKAYISVKKLDYLNISGACDVFMEEGISADVLKMVVSGASDVKGKINAKTFDLDINGASDITLTGVVENFSVNASGASDFKGYDLVTNMCEAKASGASSVSITVNKELNATASGASSVRFKGEGLIRDLKTSGASSVSRKS